MNPFQNTNPAIRDITADIGVSRNIVAIETPSRGCWRVTVNKKPVADWCNRLDAERDATRRGWRPDGKPGNPASMLNERPGKMTPSNARAYLATDCELMANEDVMLSTGPRMKFAGP